MIDALTSLIERLEKATEGSRDLDWAIDCILKPWHAGCQCEYWTVDNNDLYGIRWFSEEKQKWFPDHLPTYTDSIDAAVELVPDGWQISRFETKDTSRKHHFDLAHVTPNLDNDGGWASCPTREASRAATPAIALCIASLRARLALSTTQGTVS